METIFNTCVKVTSQEQCDRLRQICIDNSLSLWSSEIAFRFDGTQANPTFEFSGEGFGVFDNFWHDTKNDVTEHEWLELLDEHNKNLSK